MTKEEILKLDTDNMSEKTARIYGLDILQNNLAPDRERFRRRGSFALLFVSTFVILMITDSPKSLIWLSLFAAAVALFMFVSTVAARYNRNKVLKQFQDNTFKDGYVRFLKEYQKYLVDNQAKQEQRKKQMEARQRKHPQRAGRTPAQGGQGAQGKKKSISQLARMNTKNID